MVPTIGATVVSVFMASRIRCMRNHALRAQMPYLRSISQAATPFLEATISKMTRTQRRIGRRVPCIIVPVVAEN